MIYFYKQAALFPFQLSLIGRFFEIFPSKNRLSRNGKDGSPVLNNTSDENNKNESRQNELEIRFDPSREFHAVAGIDFFHVFIKTPSVFRNTKESKYERAELLHRLESNNTKCLNCLM